MCALNVFLTLLVLSFLVLPQLFVGHGLEVPDNVNVSAVSIIVDGKVRSPHCARGFSFSAFCLSTLGICI